MNQSQNQELTRHINQSFQSSSSLNEEIQMEREADVDQLSLQILSLETKKVEFGNTTPEQLRLNAILITIAEMGFNSFLAQHLIESENINIYALSTEEVISNLVQRIIEKEEETESLQLIRAFETNIQINSFQNSPSKDNYGPKLIVSSKPLQEQEEEEKEECSICLNQKPHREMQDRNCPCSEHIFCNMKSDCIQNYLANLINTSQVEVIKCPFDGCEQEYPQQYLSIILKHQMLEKYVRFKRIKIISKNPDVKWCPRIGCQEYVVGPPKAGEAFLKCPCGQAICFNCGYPYHQRISCQNILDQSYRDALKKYIIQPCPKCCAPIQKLSGCNHMTCFKCNYQFCWLCRIQYFSGHYKRTHLLGCYGGQFDYQKPSKCPLIRIGLLVIPRLLLLMCLLILKLLRICFQILWWCISYFPQMLALKLYWSNDLLRKQQHVLLFPQQTTKVEILDVVGIIDYCRYCHASNNSASPNNSRLVHSGLQAISSLKSLLQIINFMSELNKPCVYFAIGLMSGSSLDGLDIAYCCFQKKHISPEKWDHSVIIADTVKFTEDILAPLKQASQMTAYELARFNVEFGKWMGIQVQQFIQKNEINRVFTYYNINSWTSSALMAIQSSTAPKRGSLCKQDIQLQLRLNFPNPQLPISGRLMWRLVGKVPPLCQSAIDNSTQSGIANLTYTDPLNKHELIAYDICICNQLLNHYASQLNEIGYDEFGNLAKSGQSDEEMEKKLQAVEFHSLPPPKSLNNEHLGEAILPIFEEQAEQPAQNKLATAVQFITDQIKLSIEKVVTKQIDITQSILIQSNVKQSQEFEQEQGLEVEEAPKKPQLLEPLKMLATGGGAFNTYLMEVLAAKLLPIGVIIAKAPDYEIQFKEAIVMAFMAVLRLRKEISVLSSVTGARESSTGGCIYYK